MAQIAFLNDTSDWYHWGCTGTSSAIKDVLQARGHRIEAVPITALSRIKTVPERSDDFNSPEFFKQFFTLNPALAQTLLSASHVVINGEGTLHGLEKLPLLLLYIAYASKQYLNKNVQVINHSCYPDSDGAPNPVSDASRMYQAVYRVLDYVAIREKHSLEAVRALGIDAVLAFDCLPLYIQHHYSLPPPRNPQSLVLAGSVFLRRKNIGDIAGYIAHMENQGYVVTLLTGASAHPAVDDAEFIKALKQEKPEGWEHKDAVSLTDWLNTIASAGLLVSGRFHYTVASCMLGTPCVVFGSNTAKNVALCEDAALSPPLLLDAENFSQQLITRTQEALAAGPMPGQLRENWCRRAMVNFDRL